MPECRTSILAARLLQLKEAQILVLVYDLLVGQGIRPHGGPERAVLAHEGNFNKCASSLLAAHSATHLSDLLPPTCRQNPSPASGQRHLRVNTLLTTVERVQKLFKHPPDSWPQEHRHPIKAEVDAHLPDVLVVPADRTMHDHPLVACGMLVLQSKASCMPAHALGARAGWHVVDACAAPGNKTTHIASFVRGEGRIFAFERDQRRCRTLQKMIDRAGIAHVDVYERVCSCAFAEVTSSGLRECDQCFVVCSDHRA
jgi:25S rRNA (cytosine2278-C5)-methyltransferase